MFYFINRLICRLFGCNYEKTVQIGFTDKYGRKCIERNCYRCGSENVYFSNSKEDL